ncbi:thiol reductant ABC exporter subunit CydD [Rathayibacter sp. YIM 133350]|uniref:thiol reductant ABC exporter subunit CydD n=1 Tax=Rathayibacter sp. YIM 133350 TaxID=3131992 RepID=UPI00307F0045
MVAGAAIALVRTAAIVASAYFLAALVSTLAASRSLAGMGGMLAGFAAAVLIRAACGWAMDAASAAASARVKQQLRLAASAALERLGPGGVRARTATRLTTILGTGLDALDAYFGSYVPQLISTAVATPVLVLAMLWSDPLSGVIVILVLPLIPVFMVLVGWATQSVQTRQWAALHSLSGAFVEVVGGLATLKIFGRAARQRDRIATVTEQYRATTMRVLRVSFLSGFVLELAASLSVALVAVQIGLRLLDGSLGLAVGLFILLLAPEAFLPLRGVGTAFHAAADGIAASDDVLALLEDAEARPAREAVVGGSPRGLELVLDEVGVEVGGDVLLAPTSARLASGCVTALVGASGAGKTTLLRAIAGLVPHSGAVLLGDRPVTGDRIAWVPQQPHLLAGTVAANVAIGQARDDASIRVALADAGLPGIDVEWPLGAEGAGLSGGQAQRVAIARALYRARVQGCEVLLLDEPSSALDAHAEQHLLRTLRRFADDGVLVLVATHRPALIEAADAMLAVGEAVHA